MTSSLSTQRNAIIPQQSVTLILVNPANTATHHECLIDVGDAIAVVLSRIARDKIGLSENPYALRPVPFEDRIWAVFERLEMKPAARTTARTYITDNFSPRILRDRLAPIAGNSKIMWRNTFNSLLRRGCNYLRLFCSGGSMGEPHLNLHDEVRLARKMIRAAAVCFIESHGRPRIGSRYQAALYIISGHPLYRERGAGWFASHPRKWKPVSWWHHRHSELEFLKMAELPTSDFHP